MEIINTGVTRIVICLNNIAIKIPRFNYSWEIFLRGIIANIQERNTYKCNRFYPERQKLLCPVLWTSFGGWFLIMKRVERVMTEKEYYIDVKYDMSQYLDNFEGDDKPDNYGFLNGSVVKIDYGN